MTDTPTNPAAVVEQVDRDAAAEYFAAIGDDLRAEVARSGQYDRSACVQAFARHRLLGIEQGRAEMREEADDLLAGAIAYEITKTYVMDVPTARAVIDRARRAIPTAKERG